MNNNNWTKEIPMSNEEKYNLHQYRITQLEKNHEELKLMMVKNTDLLTKIDKKLVGIPEGGLQCQIHQLNLDTYGKRLTDVETKTDKINTKIVTWTAVASVVLFLVSQLVIPYILKEVRLTTSANKPAITQTDSYGLSLNNIQTNIQSHLR